MAPLANSKMGQDAVDRVSLLQMQHELKSWQIQSLALWACETASDPRFIELLTELTGACVWGSRQHLGRLSNRLSNWNLHSNSGHRQPRLPICRKSLDAWNHQLSSAPTASGSPSLAPVTKNTTSPSGATIASLFGSHFSDADNDLLKGIALIANAATTAQGNWQYSNDSGSTWNDIARTGLSNATALYLASTDRLRFLPATDYTGTPGELTARLIDESPTFSSYTQDPFGLTAVSYNARPSLVDINNDGTFDALIGQQNGDTIFFQNNGTLSSASFASATTNPFSLANVGGGGYASPSFADLDNDGDLDAFIGNQDGNIVYQENTGTPSSPSFAAPSTNPFGLLNAGFEASPTFADLDGDGDLDAFIGKQDGNIIYQENTGTSSSPIFAAPSTNPFGLTDIGTYASPTFADLDQDGDLDLFVGEWYQTGLFYFENTGTASAPAFAAATGNPFGISKPAPNTAGAFADLDGNGTLDLLIGVFTGSTYYLKNITPQTAQSGSFIDASNYGGSSAFSAASLCEV